MAFQILLNMMIAFIWMFLHNVWDALTFVIGYGLGFLLIFVLRRFFKAPFYGKRIVAIVKLVLLFIVELIKSGIMVLGMVISPKLKIKPGVVRMETELRGPWEITLLSCLLTLTPGSVVIETAPEQGILYLHVMDLTDIEDTIYKSKIVFEKAILEVMN